MPDCHALCANLEQAKEEFVKRFKLSMEVLENLGLDKGDYELAIRFTRDFYENNKDFIMSLIKMYGKPALVELWEERFFYFVLKWEFNFIDSLDKASALSTDQIDIENAKRYGITYVDENGEKRYPLILHNSPSGAIERDIYAILEKAYMQQSMGLTPTLPLWLSPTQVRIIPVSENFYQYSQSLCEQIESHRIRVDVDDRPLSLNRRVMDAEREWIPYILVIGEKEVQSNVFTVRVRGEKEFKKMNIEDLLVEIKSRILDKPFKPLPLPKLLSKRPKFYG